MSKAFSPIVFAATIIFTLPSLSSATLIDFDDISVPAGTSVALTNPYAGFNWSGVDVENNLRPAAYGPTGYINGIISAANAATEFGPEATFTAVSGAFALTSGYFTQGAPALRFGFPIVDTEKIVVSDNLGDSKTFEINVNAPTFETFNWNDVTTLTLRGARIVFDNLTVNESVAGAGGNIPESSTWIMLLIGFVGLGFAGYRASRKSIAIGG